MEFSLIKIIHALDLSEVLMIGLVGTIIICSMRSPSATHLAILLLVLGASFSGSTLLIVEKTAPLVRWLSLFLLVILGIMQGRQTVSLGPLLFWGYVMFGVIGLLRAIDSTWQLQRGILLGFAVLAIQNLVSVYGLNNLKFLKLSLISICIAAFIFIVVNSLLLPGHLSESQRFSGYLKGAPEYAVVLAALLPFTFWGLWEADFMAVRVLCFVGFLLGTAGLVFSCQRTGTIAGFLGVVPLCVVFYRQKRFKKTIFLGLGLLALVYVLFEHISVERIDFLLTRYSVESGLSNRDLIWAAALSMISNNVFWGRGIGGAEMVIENSFHNTYLETWFNTGVFGLILYLASEVFFIYRICRLGFTSKDPEIKCILALALGYVIGFIFIGMFESLGAGASNLNLMLFLFFGFLVSGDALPSFSQRAYGNGHGFQL